MIEYRPQDSAKTTWKQEADGLHIRAWRAQRSYTRGFWPNPAARKITNVQPALTPPKVVTGEFKWDPATGAVTLEGELADMAGATSLEVAFEYRSLKGQDANERTLPHCYTVCAPRFARVIRRYRERSGSRRVVRYRAVVKHPLLSLYGEDKKAVLSDGGGHVD